MSQQTEHKPLIGFTCGDINGIGPEILIKVLNDSRVLDFCTPVVFANNKLINFYRKFLPEVNLNYSIVKDSTRLQPKQVNLFNCWEEEVNVTPGEMNETGGKYAVISLRIASEALRAGKIGHTPFFKQFFNVPEVAMLMVAENMKIGLLTEHVAVKDVAQFITRQNIIQKISVIYQSLQKDFGINKPRIAVLGLNPHAGDEGLIGKEELEVIKPAVKDIKQKDVLCFGPYSADAFFARALYEKFDAVLALYHDQGLIPFKSLAHGEGVNYTAGLPGVRTSPDHGTAFDIAGKGKADESSTRQALFTCIDIIKSRNEYKEQYKNPLKKMSSAFVANAVDEKISEE
jgi:4-hydroxy-L-threonine phosphate dehydrogenase PdxA